MNRTPIDSSSVASQAYDAANEVLEVQFRSKDGAVWRYQPVSQETYDRMTAIGASFGSILAKEIKSSSVIVATRVFDEVPA